MKHLVRFHLDHSLIEAATSRTTPRKATSSPTPRRLLPWRSQMVRRVACSKILRVDEIAPGQRNTGHSIRLEFAGDDAILPAGQHSLEPYRCRRKRSVFQRASAFPSAKHIGPYPMLRTRLLLICSGWPLWMPEPLDAFAFKLRFGPSTTSTLTSCLPKPRIRRWPERHMKPDRRSSPLGPCGSATRLTSWMSISQTSRGRT